MINRSEQDKDTASEDAICEDVAPLEAVTEPQQKTLAGVVEGIAYAAVIATSFFPSVTRASDMPRRRSPARGAVTRQVNIRGRRQLIKGEVPADLEPHFPAGTEVAQRWDDIDSLIRHGDAIERSEMQGFIEAIRSDADIDINFELLLHLIEHNASEDSQRYLLGLTLATAARPVLGPEFRERALEAASRSERSESFSQTLVSLCRSQSLKVRQAAVSTILPDKNLRSHFTTSDLVLVSRSLNRTHLHQGYQVPVARELMSRVLERERKVFSDEHLFDVEMSILHTLEKIDMYHPDLLKNLERAEEPLLEDFIHYVIQETVHEKERYQQRVVFGPGVRLIGAINWEEGFSTDALRDLAQRFDMELLHNFKPTQDEDGYAFKGRYLNAVAQAVRQSDSPLVIDHFMHGGSNHSWFQQSRQAEDYSDILRHPSGVSYVELAETLIAPQLEEVLHGERQSIDLSHVSVLLDACRQYSVATGTLREIDRLATRAGVSVTKMPLIVSVSQKERLGWFYPSTGRSKLQEYIMREYTEDGATLTLSGLADLDRALRIGMMHKFKQEGYGSPRKITFPDPAIFSPAPIDLDQFIEKGLRTIGAEPSEIFPTNGRLSGRRSSLILELSYASAVQPGLS